MQNIIKSPLFFAFLAIIIITQSSCDKGLLPEIKFKVAAGYTSADMIVAKGTTIKVGIDAKKSEDKDVLKTFNISYKYDLATSSTSFKTETLTGAQGDNYSTDVDIPIRNQEGTEVWLFTVTNRDGLIGTIQLTLTVQ
ncbi:MAG: hypothetical protein ABI851_07590 [Saprospiraceae bacterium]